MDMDEYGYAIYIRVEQVSQPMVLVDMCYKGRKNFIQKTYNKLELR